MPSTLAWLDHDSAAQDRAKRILALFQEKGTVDQLGLGGVRDSFADLFFPGTSTIQTRLRYFLFVSWIYRRMEEQEVPSHRIAARVRDAEMALVVPLLSAREEGVFGRSAGGDLKRWPSEVYWGGLGSWGIRRFEASRAQYHRSLDELYRRRRRRGRDHELDDHEGHGEIAWHYDIPPAPVGFPEEASLDLTAEEAEFLRDRIVAEHPTSLLAWLALHPAGLPDTYIWDHPHLSVMPAEHQEALGHARLFSEVMEGAPLLFNRLVAEELGREEMVEDYASQSRAWADSLDLEVVGAWSLDGLFRTARRQGAHTIAHQAEAFVRDWVAFTLTDASGIQAMERARRMVRHREMSLKGAHSLFRNRRAREERYRGGLGVGRLVYRWPDVRVHLTDLYDAL